VARHAGENGNAQLVETNELNGNLHYLYESILRFVERYCDLSKDKPRRKSAAQTNEIVQARGNYHLFSIREAVANALVHRDLAIRDVPTRVLIY
ncbi:hypothetical protein ABKU43_21820, partial [Enterobacter hormaechei]